MLRPFLGTIQDRYNSIFFCIYCANAKKKKKKGKQEKHKHCATKEQIPSFRIAFQKLDEC